MKRILLVASSVAALAWAVRAAEPLAESDQFVSANDRISSLAYRPVRYYAGPSETPSVPIPHGGREPSELSREELENAYAAAIQRLADRGDSDLPGKHARWASERHQKRARLLQARDSLVRARDLLATEQGFQDDAAARLNTAIAAVEQALVAAGWTPSPAGDGINRTHWTPPAKP